MLIFENITFNNTWIEADAYLDNCSVGEHVRINRKEKRIEYSVENPNSWVAQACWILLNRVEENKVEQNSSYIINWY